MGTTQGNDVRVGRGDEVVVPAFGALRAAKRVHALGAVPVPVDIAPSTFCIDPEAASAAVTRRTVAVVAHDLFGHPADLVGLGKVGRRHGIQLVHSSPCPEGPYEEPPLIVSAMRRNAAYLDARLTGVVVPAVAPGTPHLYRQDVVTFEEDHVYDQADADGFIKLNALRLRIRNQLAAAKAPAR